jgi:RNA polymerase sigma factor (sigma-70 family)
MNTTGSGPRSGVPGHRRFERIYETHFDAVASYLLARTDRESAADAVARTFEIAWRRLADVPTEPLPWLLGVARRVVADQRRATGRREALITRIAETVVDAAEDHAATLGQRELVLSAVRDLSVFEREALLLIAWDGLTQREAAVTLGCSRAALALRLHRARHKLRLALSGERQRRSSGDHCSEPMPKAVTPATKEAL